MSTKVGTKGQVVIEKAIRDELGVEPGWLAVQRVVGDRVELRFFPAEHDRSLHGVLAEHTRRTVPPERWDDARRSARADAAREREGVDR